ncbi:MAG TPA: sigma-70 family RNA polymerase sigma factor [Gemmataceae bacterium]|jgi:RNA polymerase sigma factor (sigma-70 family)|nr:sigma-70 family RNA polymerase sigma factor [Gemmataceae bacterium]
MADERLGTLIRHLRRAVAPPSAVGLRDAQLLERFLRDRDEAAFELLLWRHGPMVLGTCRRVLRHAADVEDAFQATFLVLLRKAKSVSRGEALGGWLYRVAYRVALRARAAARRRAERERPGPEAAAVPAPPAPAWDDLRPVLDEEVSRLPAKEQSAFVLCHLQGKTHAEAGRELGCPAGTVSWRVARAKARLRGRLARRGLALSAAALAGVVSANATAAPVPAALVSTALRAALLGGGARAAAAGAVSAPAAALTEGVLQAMLLTKVKGVAAVVLALAVVGGGGGTLTYRAAAGPAKGGPAARLAPRAADEAAQQVAALKRENAELKDRLAQLERQLESNQVQLKRALEKAQVEVRQALADAEALRGKKLQQAQEALRKAGPTLKAPDRAENARHQADDARLRELAERYRVDALKMQQDLQARQAALAEHLAKQQAVAQQAQLEAKSLRDQLLSVQRRAEDRAASDKAARAGRANEAEAQKVRDEVEVLKAQLDVKRAEVAAAKVTAEGAAVQAERMKALRATGAAPEATFLKAQTDAAAAMAQVRVKEAELNAAQVVLMQAAKRLERGPGTAATGGSEKRLQELEAKLDALRKEIQALRQGPRRP